MSDDPMAVIRGWMEDANERNRVAEAALATVAAHRGTAERTAARIRELVGGLSGEPESMQRPRG
ncbi:MAG: hypothetical protein HKO53_04165 [Gemmatimonadetes bacterium]|nr:hypothetical protein [Gemmatimonadota bacterium]